MVISFTPQCTRTNLTPAGGYMTFTTDVQEDSDLRPYPETSLPDHTQLPESDGTFVKNWQEHPQSILLTDSIQPVLKKLHPDGQYFIGQDLGIYVPNVPPSLNGKTRRSYVLWQEFIAPSIVLEFVSGNGAEERDKTPWKGKFWIYEQVIRTPFYGIYEVNKASIEVYELIGGQYQLLAANERGHYPITSMGVELGLWQSEYLAMDLPWLRWWDLQGNLLLTGEERANRLTAQLRALGVEPEA
jgi:Uma2 family endonuclease